MTATVVYVLSLIWTFLLSVVEAGEYCYTSSIWESTKKQYCDFGCCGYGNRSCCGVSAGIIAGICLGVAAIIIGIIIIICICRRRRNQGATNQSGVVTTAGVQPGVTNPYYQYPGYVNQGYPGADYPQGTAYPSQPQPYEPGPPSYSEVAQSNGAGRVNNQGRYKTPAASKQTQI